MKDPRTAEKAATERLRAARHWVFDLDGTLTVAMHDFEALRRAIQCPPGAPILEWLQTQAPDERQRKQRQLDALEAALCGAARPAEGVHTLITSLRDRACALGIVTRNSKDNALRTLAAIGLADAFAPDVVIGREDAPAKPDPAGVVRLADRWCVGGEQLVMVGDFLFDLQAGRGAGAVTVHAEPSERGWPDHTDIRVRSLSELCSWLEN